MEKIKKEQKSTNAQDTPAKGTMEGAHRATGIVPIAAIATIEDHGLTGQKHAHHGCNWRFDDNKQIAVGTTQVFPPRIDR